MWILPVTHSCLLKPHVNPHGLSQRADVKGSIAHLLASIACPETQLISFRLVAAQDWLAKATRKRRRDTTQCG